ncbi:DNA repair and recombination protein RadA [Candidatus Micrarchaeota archaeon]|nr:DNA repair and recombination protein RadA [Candidatus Micrarchaeota archaeon]
MAKGENASELEAVAVEETSSKKKETVEEKLLEIEDLPGVSDATASKLREAGYDTVEAIAFSMPSELVEVCGIGEATAAKAINAARATMDMGFETGTDVLHRRENIEKITTGSNELDALLGGGIETQAITEAFGKFGSGKSQIGFQLCVNIQMPKDQGGAEAGAMFIDTEGTFRPERIAQIALAKNLNPEQVLSNILVARAYNSDHQMLLLDKAEEEIKKGAIKLIVVDSITSAFRSDYMGRGQLAERQMKLNKHIHTLLKFADKYNVAVYITNQVMDNPGILFGDPTTPIGGHILAHTSTYRLYLRRSKETRRIAKLVDSPNMPDGEAIFNVTEKGIGD